VPEFFLRIKGRPRPFRYVTIRRGGRLCSVITSSVRGWMKEVRDSARALNQYPLISGALKVKIRLAVKGKRGDLDNYAKPILDALEGIAFTNDSQVVKMEMEFVAPEDVEFAEVHIQSAAASEAR